MFCEAPFDTQADKYDVCGVQMSFNDFLHRCEMLDFDFDPKMVSQGRMHTRDIAKLKVH